MICVTIFMTENRKIVHSKTLTFSGHQTDRQTDRQTENVIPMSRNPSGARQKTTIVVLASEPVGGRSRATELPRFSRNVGNSIKCEKNITPPPPPNLRYKIKTRA